MRLKQEGSAYPISSHDSYELALDLELLKLIYPPMDTTHPSQILTHDERKAAEAAFARRPCNPQWSESAKRIYEGLLHALPALPEEAVALPSSSQLDSHLPETAAPTAELSLEPELSDETTEKSDDAALVQHQIQGHQLITNREQAIQAGFLIDVSADAQKLGFTFSVTITKPLWEIGIAPGHELSEQEKADRLRDILMAFRLRLAGQTTLSPLIDFPAMLALPPGSIPQAVPLFALIQPDEQNHAVATLLLPNEVSTAIIPMN